jgi:V-type H+-transporting ATPase subunit a
MFGDYGHGSLIFFVGMIFVFGHNYLKNTPMKVVAPFRYFVLLMGIFSMYMGLIYNEWFAIPFDIFGSCYETNVL